MKNETKIELRHVRVHNLKGVNLELIPNRLICFTGISGSGKSSLAFDTIFVEGQRRYVESLSAHARRFLGDLPRPDVESMSGISPTIAIEQKTAGKNPRSTVGTLTEIYDFLRVLFARVATPYCPVSGEPVRARSIADIIQEIEEKFQNRQVLILAPTIRGKKGTLEDDVDQIIKKGFSRARIDNEIVHLTSLPKLKKKATHDLDIVIDRLEITPANRQRLRESMIVALELANQTASIYDPASNEELLISTRAFSPKSGLSYAPLEPHDFSFNSPQGMCSDCQGMGFKQSYRLDLVLDEQKSIAQDCCQVASSYQTVRFKNIYDNLARIYHFDVHTPFKDLSDEAKKLYLYGTEKKWTKMYFVHPITKAVWTDTIWWRGALNEAYERYLAATSEGYKRKQEKLMSLCVCSTCQGSRIKPYPAAALFHEKSIHDLCSMTISDIYHFFENNVLTSEEKLIGEEIIKEMKERLHFLLQVGLEYLQLSRTAPTLSGGEAQRVRLASQIGCGLVGVTYILDEPSIGLHPRDNKKLIYSLQKLCNKGNTVIIVEHDEETIHAADHIVDFGPRAGINGGEILFSGTLNSLLKNKKSLTADYLSKRKVIEAKTEYRIPKSWITLSGATHHNLKNVTLKMPLSCFVAVTGVSGSGKSSLFLETLYPALHNTLMDGDLPVGAFSSIEGVDSIDKVIEIDQSPIGRTPRSNPATYISLFDDIRELFAGLPESKAKGFKNGRFSFNVKEGSCSECHGMGMLKIEMDFLEDSYIECPLCEGKRFDAETLSVRYKEKNIQDVLDMDVKEALDLFEAIPSIRKKLTLMDQVGLDYLKLGQSSTTLSGGEAQRMKLARELVRPASGKTLYILDEPTTGLHFHDIQNLLHVLHALVDRGNSVCVIEHNMDVVKTADYIIDIGPESGDLGGTIVQVGTPRDIAKSKTPTGEALDFALQGFTYPKKAKTRKATKALPRINVIKAKQNNLQDVSCCINHHEITCIIGPSGSGKSSLAFDTLYAEGQRRYVESLSPYVRQFVKQLPKPQVEKIDGLAPTVAIEQRVHASNPRSTVGTMTEIYDYLRVLYARLGIAHCPKTGFTIKAISKELVVERLLSLKPGTKLTIMAPITLKKTSLHDELQRLKTLGFLRVRLNNEVIHLADVEVTTLTSFKRNNELSLVIDRIVVDPSLKMRLYEAVRVAAEYGKNKILALIDDKEQLFNLSFAVEETGESYPEITAKSFAFNTQDGMCQTCQGLGYVVGFTLETLPEVQNRTPRQLIQALTTMAHFTPLFEKLLKNIFLHLDIDPQMNIQFQYQHQLKPFFYGLDEPIQVTMNDIPVALKWIGLNRSIEIAYSYGMLTEEQQESLLSLSEKRCCPDCAGSRLNPLSRHVTLENKTIQEATSYELDELLSFVRSISYNKKDDPSLAEVFYELESRIQFLIDTGLSYISLNRDAASLSGGEEQRVRLARQIGSGLTNVLYILDEPTSGLHPKDVDRLLIALKKLKKLGNTLVIVEHDRQLIKAADALLELGPGSGKEGGKLLFSGTPRQLQATHSVNRSFTLPKAKVKKGNENLSIHKANIHNLKDLSVDIPLGHLVTISGVSGSGKSTLLFDIIVQDLTAYFQRKKKPAYISGHEKVGKIVVVDQKPMSHTVRSDIATYIDLLSHMRIFFASLPHARQRGLQDKHFSYYSRSGMCKTCQGLGYKRVYLHFLPTVHVPCSECKGLRLRQESLQVCYQEKSLGEILNLSVKEVRGLFHHHPIISRLLDALIDVGLEYLPLSQEMHTLSSGEAQRMKLAFALTKRTPKHTLYLFDEPTNGLYALEVEKILLVLRRLVDAGHSVIAIEHNLDFIKNSDYLVDLGPGAANNGGNIVAIGTPEQVAQVAESVTGQYLSQMSGIHEAKH